MRLVLSSVTQDAMLESVRQLLDGGELRIFNSSPPASPQAPLTNQKHLATVRFVETLLDAGQVRGSFDTDQLAIDSGDATWARAYAADGSAILDCDIGTDTDGACIELNTARLRKGGPVVIHSFSLGVGR
jgi:hypothetical protein